MNGRVLFVLLLIVAAAMMQGGGTISPLAPAVTAAIYVYEKDDSLVPGAVMFAINRLNREKKIDARIVDDDVVDGNGQTPDSLKVPIEAARTAGLPSLVVMGGTTVVRTVKAPTTEQQVWEAAQ